MDGTTTTKSEEQELQLSQLQNILHELDDDGIEYEDDDAEYDYQATNIRKGAAETEDTLEDLGLTANLDDVEDDVVSDTDDDIGILTQDLSNVDFDEEIADISKVTGVKTKGHLLEQTTMREITEELKDSFHQSLVGFPRIIHPSAADSLLAVGTSFGLILLFTMHNKKRIAVMGTLSQEKKMGGITSLQFGPPGSNFLVAGYSNGNLTFWNIKSFLPIVTFPLAFSSAVDFISIVSDADPYSNLVSVIVGCSSAHIKMYKIRKSTLQIEGPPILINIRELINEKGSKEKRILNDDDDDEEEEEEMENREPQLDDRLDDLKALPQSEASHPLDEMGIVAVSYQGKVHILQTKPHPTIIQTLQDHGDLYNTVKPLVAWKGSEIPNGYYKTRNDIPAGTTPLLAIAWNDNIILYTAIIDEQTGFLRVEPGFGAQVKVEFPRTNALTFLYQGILVAGNEALTEYSIINADVSRDQTIKVIETIKLEESEIGIPIHYNCMESTTDRSSLPLDINRDSSSLFILGTGNILELKVKSWDTRVEDISRTGKEEALSFVISIYNDVGEAVVRLPSDKKERRNIVATQIGKLLGGYIKESIEYQKNQNQTEDENLKAFESIGRRCIDIALQINDFKIFWLIYDIFEKENKSDIFLSLLSPFILNVERTVDRTPLKTLFNGKDDTLFKRFIEYHRDKKNLEELEQCLLLMELFRNKLPEESDQQYESYKNEQYEFLRELSERYHTSTEKYKLLKLYCHVYNITMMQKEKNCFVIPLVKLIDMHETDKNKNIEDAIITYLSVYLSGQGFSPVYSLTVKEMKMVRKSLLDHIFEESSLGTSLNANQKSRRYPNFEKLLLLNSHKIFEILEKIFLDHSPSSPWTEYQAKKRQDIINDLISLMVSFKKRMYPFSNIEESNLSYPLAVIVDFFTFLNYVASKGTKEDNNYIDIPLEVFYHSINFLTQDRNCNDDDTISKRQNSIRALLERFQNIDKLEKIASSAKDAKYFRVAIDTYTKLHSYKEVIDCYLEEETMKKDVFSYINKIYQDQNLQVIEFESVIFDEYYLKRLISVNASQFAELVVAHFQHKYRDVIDMLTRTDSEDSKYLFEYLKSLFTLKHEYQAKIELDEEIQFRYIKGMCIHDPKMIHQFLQVNQSSKLDAILKYCEDVIDRNDQEKDTEKQFSQEHIHHLQNAICFLYERKGEVTTALTKILSKIDVKKQILTEMLQNHANIAGDTTEYIEKFKDYCNSETSVTSSSLTSGYVGDAAIMTFPLPKINKMEMTDTVEYKELRKELFNAIKVCDTNTKRKTIDNPENLWFMLLEAFSKPMRHLRNLALGVNDEAEESETDNIQKEIDDIIKAIAEFDAKIEELNDDKNQGFLEEDEFEDAVKIYEESKRFEEGKLQRKQEEKQKREKSKNQASENVMKPLTTLWLQRVYHICVATILDKMIEFVPLPTVLKKVIEDNTKDEFGQLKQQIFKMLTLYEYENRLLNITNDVLEDDNYFLAKRYKKELSKGLRSKNTECLLCGKAVSLKKEDEFVRIFDCGHCYHSRCLRGVGYCLLCMDKRGGRKSRANMGDENKDGQEKISIVGMKLEKLDAIEELLENKSKMHLHKSLEITVLKRKTENTDDRYANFSSQLESGPRPPKPLADRSTVRKEDMKPIDPKQLDTKSLFDEVMNDLAVYNPATSSYNF